MISPSLKCSKQLMFLINDILDMSQITKGSFQFNFEKINIVDHLTYMSDLLKIMAKMKGINLHTDYMGSPYYIATDPNRLQ